MTARTVTTQAELDAALAEGVDCVDVQSPAGVWLEVRAHDSDTVTGSSTVTAYDSSTVTALDSSTVTAYGSSTVRAYGSSTVRAYGSSTVTAYGSSTVRAYGSSTVRAQSRVAVHLHSGRAHVSGGVLIDHSTEPATAAEWCAYHDVTVTDGIATVYKAVNNAWTTARGADYSPGSTPGAPDWRPSAKCGGGLHFSPSPAEALAYHSEATRFVAVGVAVADLVPLPGGTAKCKAPRVVVACREVTIDGKAVQ